MVVFIKILQVVLALSILILVHEFGHFLFAKIFGIRVDKFYLFFDAGGKYLISTKRSKWLHRFFPALKDCETDFGIGWVPLGGYCKIAGMIDESMDKEFLNHEPQPWEFRSKPAWQRLFVMAGGVLFNFILAICVYIGILAVYGESYFSNEGNEIYVNELAYDLGFRNGDHIIALDGVEPENFGTIQADIVRNRVTKATILRGGDTLNIYIDHNYIGDMLNSPGMFDLAVPFVVDTIPATSPNYGSELSSGDRIVVIDGVPVSYVQDSRSLLAENSGGSVDAVVLRNEDTLLMNLQVDTTGKLGVYTQMPPVTVKKYKGLEAVPAGFRLAWDTVEGYVSDLKLVFTPSTEAYKSVGSFISIGQIFPSAWNWYAFLNILALLSIMLGVMNLLPIPALDGGHMVFTIYEIVTGRKPSDRFLEVMQIVGFLFVMGLMVLACGNDIVKLIR